MPRFQWDQSMDTGNPMLDREHRTLVDLLNKVLEISAAPDRDVEIMHALTDMYLYAKEHFFDEEGLMERVGYPDRERHTALHRAFVEKAKALTDDCLEGSLDFAEFAEYLMNWLKRHIADEDLRIIRWAEEQGENGDDTGAACAGPQSRSETGRPRNGPGPQPSPLKTDASPRRQRAQGTDRPS